MTNKWCKYERTGSIEVRPFEAEDERNCRISISPADAERESLVGGWVARNPENHEDQWYIAPEFFAKHHRQSQSEPEVSVAMLADKGRVVTHPAYPPDDERRYAAHEPGSTQAPNEQLSSVVAEIGRRFSNPRLNFERADPFIQLKLSEWEVLQRALRQSQPEPQARHVDPHTHRCLRCGGSGLVRDSDTNMGGPCPACSPEWRGVRAQEPSEQHSRCTRCATPLTTDEAGRVKCSHCGLVFVEVVEA